MSEYKINILHLYPDLLNLYGDKGNIECMKKRLKWRGIDSEVISCTNENNNIDFENADIIFIGGGTDKAQEMVCERLREKRAEIVEFVENGGVMVAVCGAYQFLGKYYHTAEKKIDGIGILDIYTDLAPDGKRMIGDAVIECDGLSHKVVGFENHDGKTYIGSYKPLGKVIKGYGNNGESGYEGIEYKNLIGTYFSGPLFPKNPELCDKVLTAALKKKYADFVELKELDNTLELLANAYMAERN